MDKTKDINNKERKKKSTSFPDMAAILLVDLFIRDERKYNERVVGGSKKGKTPRQKCLENWQIELAAIGCDKDVDQIYARIRGDIISVRSILTNEKAERGKTGGGLAKKAPKLDQARSKLYEHLQGSHCVLGLPSGLESGQEVEKEKVDEEFHDSEENRSEHSSIRSPLSIEEPLEEAPKATATEKKTTFSGFVKQTRKRQNPETSTSSGELLDMRMKLLESEYQLSMKKSRNADEEFGQLQTQSTILQLQLETAEINRKIAIASAEKLGITL